MKKLCILVFMFLCALQINSMAQGGTAIDKQLEQLRTRQTYNMHKEHWNAAWIEVPDADRNAFGVYYFRKDIELSSLPETFLIHVSADQRYKLYVNGHLASLGPARNDSKHWNYETLDIAQYLTAGKNVVAAQVWSEGQFKPIANATIRPGFILLGEGEASVLNTDNSWKCRQDFSYTPIRQQVPGYYALGAGEKIDMNSHIGDWLDPDNQLTDWIQAKSYAVGAPHDDSSGTGTYLGHPLVPSSLPQVERYERRLKSVRRDGGLKLPKGWPEKQAVVYIPANKTIDILLDQQELTNGYFNLSFSKGKDAVIEITYAEAMFASRVTEANQRGPAKGNRNEIEGKEIIGRNDILISSGKPAQRFSSLDWRTFRYVNLHIETKDEPLEIDDINSTFVGFPFELKASLATEDQELQKMLDIGWRTARLCAIETYTDCPFYEQLQYLGDTRIQALVSLYNTADDRLVRNYLRQADMSRNAEGITMGRAPSETPQYITPYALHYIYALHDYLMYGGDVNFVYDLVPGAEQILHFFLRYTLPDGRVSGLPGWNFSDWCFNEGWQLGVPQPAKDGATSILDLQLLLAYQMLGDIEQYMGNDFMAKRYKDREVKLADAIKQCYWVEDKGLFANNSDLKQFSQHAQSLAIITGLVRGEDARLLARKTLEDPTLDYCTIYFRFYMHQALAMAGLGDDYLKWLDKWRENIAMGMTTWGETSDVNTTRSDCHAWGASPNIELFRILLGIDSAAPGFKSVRIAPHLGDIRKIGGTMPHPDGMISVSYEVKAGKGRNGTSTLNVDIQLPASLSGDFIWQGKSYQLHGGDNHLVITNIE